MKQKGVVMSLLGALLIVASVGLVWFGFSTNSPNPAPAFSALAGGVASFIVAVVLISRGTRSMPAVESPALLRQSGTLMFVVGGLLTAYAAATFFLLREWPPNTPASRLPSLYLLFGGMAVLFFGMVIRNFRLR